MRREKGWHEVVNTLPKKRYSKAFPPRQRPSSFTIDEAFSKLAASSS